MKHTANRYFPRWIAFTVTCILFLFIVFGAWFFQVQEKQQRESAEANLLAIADLKAGQIVNWRNERLSDAKVLMGRIDLIDSIERYFSYPTEQEKAIILRRLQSVKESYGYEDILVVKIEKQIVLSLGSEVGLCSAYAQVLDEAVKKRSPMWTPLHAIHDGSFPHLSVIVPLLEKKSSRNPIGALVLVCDAAQFLYPLIQSWPTPSTTAETLLVRQDGNDVLFLNDLRHQKDSALKLRIDLSREDLPAAKAVKGITGIVEGKDYRGVEVIAAILSVPDSPWFMVSKMDASEAFAEWHFRSIMILVFILGMAVLIIAAGLFDLAAKSQNLL